MNRRTILKAGAVFAATSHTAIAVPAPITKAQTLPTREELEHYYAFLWEELIELSKEMGCEMCDSYTAHRSGGLENYKKHFGSSFPSTRAKAVLEGVRQ